ncbi:Asp23/Gls24 family envelope stress response protein [Amycolatopsis sp. PS_44_ISF1]|uniref:Asp23/Gls24 family envelope stress response protein n=1 Tax=Amycolatopsis sp. PS_44_ISF1 TaxID=2974917 RepID=UPI0028DF7524|nr:Asp23/Gls24 family envelope stress response protein [Amycolatopsis sp. PS_44_ISF1]MDT8914058.1 Asp23/Gls24 family envelope stress response protein [Amycolatopsis sp. PS_44_ISF1]
MTAPVAGVDRPRAGLAEPGERGTLSIAHAVVRKIAQHAADQVPGTVRAGRTGARVRVGGQDNDVDLALDLALRYPGPVRAVTGDVRSKVTEEVERITAYRVRSVAVTVSALLPDARPRVR